MLAATKPNMLDAAMGYGVLKNGTVKRRLGEKTTRSEAFTLVELLVVIAIIGLLAALLLASLSGAKQRSVRAKCLNNERQVYLGMRIYADENNDTLPPREEPYWVAQLQPYYVKARVLMCPADVSRAWIDPDQVVTNSPNPTSYILNAFNYYAADGATIIDDDGTPRVAGGVAVDLRPISSPSTAILLAEKRDYSASNNSFYMDYAGN